MGNNKVKITNTFVRAIFTHVFPSLVLITLLIQGFCPTAGAYANDPLTLEEREWLIQHDGKIVLGHAPNVRPIDFYDENNVFSGLAADYVDLLQKKLHFKFKLSKNKTWAEVVEKAKKREIDVISTFTETPARSEWMNFTPPYIKVPAIILVRDEIQGSLNLEQMKGMRITFTKGWVVEEYLNSYYGHLNLFPVVDEETAIKDVSLGQADAAVTPLTSALVHIERYKITNLRVAGDTGFFFDLAMASRKDMPILNRILSKGLAQINQQERDSIYNKWINFEKRPFYYSKIVLYSFFIVIGGIILVVALIFVWNRSLKRQVALKTEELKNEVNVRKKAEEQIKRSQILLNSTLESPKDMIILAIDKSYRYLHFNEAHKSDMLSAYNKNVEIGMSILDFITTEQDRNRLISNYNRALSGENFVEIQVYGDKEKLYYETRFNPIVDDTGETIGVTAFAMDITERMQAEEQIKSALKEKETLLHEIHHRVKNNMQVINSLLKLQVKNVEDQYVKDILKDSQSRVYAMSAVHETLHGSEKLSEIDLKAYLSKITNSIFQTYATNHRKVKLNSNIENLPISINQAYPLGLLINELISNSLKYAFPDEREGEISVSMRELDKELELAVADNGVGLADGLDWKNSNTLGLKLVRTLVENQLDGSIDMESDNGTKFTIKFNIDTQS